MWKERVPCFSPFLSLMGGLCSMTAWCHYSMRGGRSLIPRERLIVVFASFWTGAYEICWPQMEGQICFPGQRRRRWGEGGALTGNMNFACFGFQEQNWFLRQSSSGMKAGSRRCGRMVQEGGGGRWERGLFGSFRGGCLRLKGDPREKERRVLHTLWIPAVFVMA